MKKRRYFIVAFLVSMLILLLFTSVFAGTPPENVRLLVHFSGIPDRSLIALHGGRVLHAYTLLPKVLAVEVPVSALAGLSNNPQITLIEEDVLVQTVGKPSPSPPAQVLPWGVDKIDAELSSATGLGVKVCIVDTGIKKNHADLQANILGGKNFVAKGATIDANKWDDDNGHGTHVAGTVAALNNAIGVVGVAPRASLLVAKVLNRQGSGYLSDVIAGVDWCVSQNAKVISMSLGTSSDIQAQHDAVDGAYAAGALIVAAAGNDYGGSVIYPAAYSSVIAVSATDSNNNLAAFSNIGPEIELTAPGVNILSTWYDGSYATLSGTSMAAPHVSGVAALAWELNPLMSNVEIRTLLQSTADDLGTVGKDISFGYGLVDAKLN